MHELVLFRQRKLQALGSNLSAKAVAEEFNKGARLAKDTEPVTTDTVYHAVVVYEKAFKLPRVVQCVELLEGHCGTTSPFNSIAKLNTIVRRAKGAEELEWLFSCITDKVVSAAMPTEEFGVRSMPLIVDVFILRLQLLRHLGHQALEKLQPTADVREKYWQVFASHSAYRDNLAPLAGSRPELAWRAGWPRSIIAFFTWVEEFIYKG